MVCQSCGEKAPNCILPFGHVARARRGGIGMRAAARQAHGFGVLFNRCRGRPA